MNWIKLLSDIVFKPHNFPLKQATIFYNGACYGFRFTGISKWYFEQANAEVCSSPIQTFTVGPGVSPDLSPCITGRLAGFTAGRDFHPAPKNKTNLNILKNLVNNFSYHLTPGKIF